MEEILEMLEAWKNLPYSNKIIEKDYFIESSRVHLYVAVTVEKAFLFKTFTAICPLTPQAIEDAFNKLDERKDELI